LGSCNNTAIADKASPHRAFTQQLSVHYTCFVTTKNQHLDDSNLGRLEHAPVVSVLRNAKGVESGKAHGVVAGLNLGAVAELALGPPVLVVELELGGVGVAVDPQNGEGDGDVGVVDGASGLVDAVDGANVAVLAGNKGPRPLALGPVRLEDIPSNLSMYELCIRLFSDPM
jgi:hypothetical protein